MEVSRLRNLAVVLLLLVTGIYLAWPFSTPRVYPKRKPVQFWHMWSGEWKDVIDKIVDRFNKSQTEYELVALSVPQSASTKCLLGIAGGDPPDVMAQWEGVIPTWAERKAIMPLDSLLTPQEYAKFKADAYPVVLRLGIYKGHLYTVTPTLNLSACYVNVEQMKEAGFDPNQFPKTLEELSDLGKKLDRKDSNGTVLRQGFSPGSWTNLAPLYGGGFYDWKTGKLTLNTPANERALAFLVKEMNAMGFDNYVRFTAGFGSDSGEAWSFLAGKQTIVLDGQWRVEQMGKVAPNFKYRVFPLPPPVGGVPLSGFTNGNQMIIPSGAKEPQGAMAFIKFWSGITDPEVAADFITWGGWLPMTKSVGNSKTYQAYIKKFPEFGQFLNQMPSTKFQPMPPVAIQMFVQDKINQCQDLAIRGTLTPKQACERLESEVAHELIRRKELGYE